MEFNHDDDDDLEFGKVVYIIENSYKGAENVKVTDDDKRKSAKYDEYMKQQYIVNYERGYVKLFKEADRKY